MPKGTYLGEFEQHVLAAVLRLRDNAYGMTIRREIAERTGRDVSIGAVYATLDRLEQKGFVSSRTGEATPERGGRAKRYFAIEAPGVRALEESWRASDQMRDGLEPVPAFSNTSVIAKTCRRGFETVGSTRVALCRNPG